MVLLLNQTFCIKMSLERHPGVVLWDNNFNNRNVNSVTCNIKACYPVESTETENATTPVYIIALLLMEKYCS